MKGQSFGSVDDFIYCAVCGQQVNEVDKLRFKNRCGPCAERREHIATALLAGLLSRRGEKTIYFKGEDKSVVMDALRYADELLAAVEEGKHGQ